MGICVRYMVNINAGFTLNLLQLGREVNMPADIMLGVPVSKEPPQGHAEYAKQLIQRLGVAYAEVCKNLREAQVRQKS